MLIFKTLNLEADYENLSTDSTSVKAHQHNAGTKKGAINYETNQHIGKSCGGNTTKMIVDGIGNPVYFQLSAGNINDSIEAIDVLSHVDLSTNNVLGDKAYGTIEIRKYITHKGQHILFQLKLTY